MSKSKTFFRLMRYMLRYKGLSILALLFILMTSIVATAIPLLAQYYIDHYITKNIAKAGLYILIIYFGLFILRVVFTFLGEYYFAKVAHSIVRDLRNDSFANLQKLGMSYFDKTPVGSVVSRLTNDTQAVADMFGTIFSSFLNTILMFVVTLSAMIALSWQLTIYMILFIPVMVGSVYLYQKLSSRLVEISRAKISEMNTKLSESIEGMKIIQAFNQEQRLIDEFGEVNNEHLRYYTKSLKVDSLLLRPAMALFKVLAYGVIVMYFGLSFESAGFTAGIIYAFIQYTNQLFNPLIELMQNFSILQTSIISAGRVFTLIDNEEYEPEQKDSDHKISRGDIEFKNVSFSYDGKRDVLKNISFSVKNGESIAFVGATGSGKSSIMNLFLRFYDYDRGEILIDGVNIKDYSSKELRNSVGLVLQDPFLYHGTVESNIKMYNESLTREDVIEAAKFVDAHNFIDKLEDKYYSLVTERGSTFSSGERQLLTFARTIASKPKILILDEATANIDSETEELIQHSLEKMRKGRTTIAIAHRLSTIQDSNCIYVLDKGEIIESGTHDELIALKGNYYKMYQLQAGMLNK
ncbi:ABC transporter ATP-binding protein [Gemella haemolysans]|uniref:ATP synthase F0, A subunit n=1 Tax=Gemella haemolysans ATCC 10379 TaxID=546270 RepID=C5NYF2_9BACL|nr:ABC transporter ATP-binding protein [Gemella haemolysans]EER67732.1 putative ATP synthase F0, A subunit [Gemella haemolysans ATCC 10379]KAA8709298.1 ABC transporter ATP-binding protein [Gemella haemolysans]UBH82999.1 ABC transporter ATP-binding protein/permease [Gemella haemolysans]VEI38731.1 Probable multidrug resistance ABC transporter ATP-binding/permease protein YheH [Gemella haemolysans]